MKADIHTVVTFLMNLGWEVTKWIFIEVVINTLSKIIEKQKTRYKEQKITKYIHTVTENEYDTPSK